VAAVAALTFATMTFISVGATTSADAQVPAAASAMPGSYTSASGLNNLRFFVSSNHRQLQDIDAPPIRLFCAPGGGYYDEPFIVDVVSLTANGYFSAKGSQPVVVPGGDRGNLSYAFTGYVKNSGGAGDLILTLTFTDGSTHYTCRPTSSDISWTATRDDQPAQTNAPPPAGLYTNAQDVSYPIGLSFFVKPKQLGHITTNAIRMFCTPHGDYFDETFFINAIPLKSDGSFSGKASLPANVPGFGVTGTLTDTFQGHFHGVGISKVARAAGVLNETLTFKADNTPYWCTETIYWVATLGGK